MWAKSSDVFAPAYPHIPFKAGRKIFPTIVTVENWRMFGSVMMSKLGDAVTIKLGDAGLPRDFVKGMPYSILAVEELEIALQIMRTNGIADFMEGKLTSEEMSQWEWHGYMIKLFPKSFPTKRLFEKDYNEIFDDLYRAQDADE
jgi:hypothetical protein